MSEADAVSPELIADLEDAEGRRLTTYRDSKGNLTIGIGHTGPEVCDGLVWTASQCDTALLADIRDAMARLDRYLPWWRGLDPVRRDAMTELMFNMGPGNADHGLLSFHNTLKAIAAGNYGLAAVGLLSSVWAREVGDRRAKRIASMIRTGARP